MICESVAILIKDEQLPKIESFLIRSTPGIFPRTFAMDAQTSTLKNFQLVHQLKRRIRILSPVLKNDQERGYILKFF